MFWFGGGKDEASVVVAEVVNEDGDFSFGDVKTVVEIT